MSLRRIIGLTTLCIALDAPGEIQRGYEYVSHLPDRCARRLYEKFCPNNTCYVALSPSAIVAGMGGAEMRQDGSIRPQSPPYDRP